MNYEFIIAKVKQIDTHENGRAELPWDFRNKIDPRTGLNEFVTVSQKPEKLTKEQFT